MKKPPSQRQLRVGELIRHELAAAILRGDLDDPAISRAGVTVTQVETSPDLKIATVFVRPLIEGHGHIIVEALAREARHIRGLLAPRLGLRYMPQFRFRYDTSLDYARHIDEILTSPDVRRDLDTPPGGAD